MDHKGLCRAQKEIPDEAIHDWIRRRAHIARLVGAKLGMWSELWARKVIDWHEHSIRGDAYDSFVSRALAIRDNNWLISRRLSYVAENGAPDARRTPRAGRTGTRLSGLGKVQIRWEVGVQTVQVLLNSRSESLRGGRSIGIGTRIKEVGAFIHSFFASSHD